MYGGVPTKREEIVVPLRELSPGQPPLMSKLSSTLGIIGFVDIPGHTKILASRSKKSGVNDISF